MAQKSNQVLPLAWAAISALSIIFFVFSVLSLTSTHWATSDVLVSPDGSRSAATAQYAATNYRGPYHSAYFSFVQNPATGNFTNSTTTYSTICTDKDDVAICQQLKIGTKTLIAGSALAGLTMVAAIVLFVVSFAVARLSKLLSEFLRRTYILLGVLAALAEAFGGLIVSNTLINLQRPDGDFISDIPDNPLQHHWTPGQGCAYVATAFVVATLAVLLAPKTVVNSRHGHDKGVARDSEGLQAKES